MNCQAYNMTELEAKTNSSYSRNTILNINDWNTDGSLK